MQSSKEQQEEIRKPSSRSMQRNRGKQQNGKDGNRLQCSCLENPRDRGACWAAVYGVAQSRTRLNRLSSSSSSIISSKSIHVVTKARFYTFLWLKNIPRCVYTTSSSINLCIDRYLCCFCILGIVDNTAINIRVHISFQISVFIFFI